MMLCERRQTQKATYCVIPLRGNVQGRQMHRDGQQTGGCRGTGGGEQGRRRTAHGFGVFGGMTNMSWNETG